MKLRCPHCGVSGSADDSFLGRKVKCPKCAGIFPVDQVVPQSVDENQAADVNSGLPTQTLSKEQASEEAGAFGDVAANLDAALLEEEDRLVSTDELLESEKGDDARSGKTQSADWDNIQGATEREPLLDEDTGELTAVEALIGDQETEELLDDGVAEEVELLSGEVEPELLSIENEDLAVEQADEREDLVLDSEEELFADAVVGESSESLEAELDFLEERTAPAVDAVTADAESAVESESTAEASAAVVQDELFGVDKETCWQCGKEDSDGEPFIAKDGRLYCTNCLPADEPELAVAASAAAGVASAASAAGARDDAGDTGAQNETPIPPMPGHFTIGGALREAWEKTKGAKGSIWGFSAVMYLVVLVVFTGVSVICSIFTSFGDIFLVEVGSLLLQFITDFVGMIFTAGLLFMGVRRATGEKIPWNLGMTAFSYSGKIIIASVLQTFMLIIGFLLLILPGIYLMIGYSMTLPLIVERGMGAWEAMEASRKAVHKVWWRVFGLYIVVGLLVTIAMLPLGLGLIWVWPMVFILAGVVYRHLFGTRY